MRHYQLQRVVAARSFQVVKDSNDLNELRNLTPGDEWRIVDLRNNDVVESQLYAATEWRARYEARIRELEAQAAATRERIGFFVEAVDAAVAAANAPKTGMRVPFHGDFASAVPSVLSRLQWWARDLHTATTMDAGRALLAELEALRAVAKAAWDAESVVLSRALAALDKLKEKP